MSAGRWVRLADTADACQRPVLHVGVVCRNGSVYFTHVNTPRFSGRRAGLLRPGRESVPAGWRSSRIAVHVMCGPGGI